MKKYLKYLALFMALLPLLANGHEIILLPSLQRDTTDVDTIMPTRDVELVEDGVIVTYHFNAATLVSDPLYANCKFWRINGFGTNVAATEPAFPLRVDNFKLPRNATGCQIILLDSTYVDVSMKIAPARPPLSDNDTIGYNLSNVPPISTYLGRFPSSTTNNYNTYNYRGVPVVEVCVTPMQYDMANEQVRAFTMLKYKVKYDYSGASQVPAVVPVMSKLSPSDHFLENVTLNAEPIELEGDTAVLDNMDYLIISVNKYEQAVNRFANWKRTLGYRTHVVMRDTWTPAEVFSQVKQIYNQEGVNLYYLLIVGDHEDVPALSQTDDGNYVTDLFYGCMSNSVGSYNSHNVDVYRGRLSVSNIDEAQNVISKIMSYEMRPSTNLDFYHKGIHCAEFQDNNFDGVEDRRFVKTCEEIRDHLLSKGYEIQRIYCRSSVNVLPQRWSSYYSKGDSLPLDLRGNNFAWSGNTTDIINGLNSGAFFILHRDHGYNSGSGWAHPYFVKHSLSYLNNDKYPIVFSINCYTGKFNGITCFCEEFLRKENAGCVAVYGASNVSYSGENDAFTLGMFDAVWPGIRPQFLNDNGEYNEHVPIYQLGPIMEYGKGFMKEHYSNSDYISRIFHLFGDPSMEMRTSVPEEFENVSVQRTGNRIQVQTGEDDCRISFYNPINNEVNCYYGSDVNFTTDVPANWTVCVSSHNKIPHLNYGDLYIQNETIDGIVEYNGNNIYVGHSVTDLKPYGDVYLNSGNVTLKGKQIKLFPSVFVKKGTTLTINPKK